MKSLPLVASFLVQITLNVFVFGKYQRRATEGYAYSYLQPDDASFAFWGFIYSLLTVLVFTQARKLNKEALHSLSSAFLLNGFWLIANSAAVNHDLSYWFAVVVLGLYAVMLAMAYDSAGVNYHAGDVNWSLKLGGFAPISVNLAWVVIAAILNVTNTVADMRLDFTKRENLTKVGSPDWTIAMIGLSALTSIRLSFTRSDVFYALGCAWAYLGIARNQSGEEDASNFHTANKDHKQPLQPRIADFAHNAAAGVVLVALVSFVANWFLESRRMERVETAMLIGMDGQRAGDTLTEGEEEEEEGEGLPQGLLRRPARGALQRDVSFDFRVHNSYEEPLPGKSPSPISVVMPQQEPLLERKNGTRV